MNATRQLFLLPLLSLALLAGCGAPTADTGAIAPDPTATAADPADALEVTPVSLSAEEMEQIKKLPEADQAAALEQKICPSSGENLGSMGAPIKVDAKGQAVFICCAGCKEDVEKNPDAVLAKLGKTAAEAEPTATP